MAAVSPRDDSERAKQLAMIHHLAQELGLPELVVGPICEREFQRLGAQAKVKDFLVILVGRRVKESFTR